MPAGRNPIDVEIGRRIRQRRADLGMSLDHLARQLGVAARQVQAYEEGTDRVSAYDLMLIVRALHWKVGGVFDPPPLQAAKRRDRPN